MLTFFTTAKPFQGHSAVIQRNALKSWTLLHPDVEVILFGNDEGAAEVARELGIRHEPHAERHESGMKYLNYMFARAQQIARHGYLCYSNCDIVLMNDFWSAFEKTVGWRRDFLLIGQRWDTNVTEPIKFAGADWASSLRKLALTIGLHQVPDFIDFFVFPKGLIDDMPPLILGRSYWDHWIVWKALSVGAPVLDCTPFVVPVHQNHDYGYHPGGKQGTNEDPLAIRNRELSGKGKHLRSILDATHILTADGGIRRTPFRRIVTYLLSPRELWFYLKCKTFPLRNRLGLRKESFRKLRGHPAKPVD
jgi:hypothetical protein